MVTKGTNAAQLSGPILRFTLKYSIIPQELKPIFISFGLLNEKKKKIRLLPQINFSVSTLKIASPTRNMIIGGIKREIREYNFLVVLCQHLVYITSSHDAI